MAGTQHQSPAATAAQLQARGLDSALGCLVAVVVFELLSKKLPSGWLPITLADTSYAAAASVVDQFTPATVTSWPALTARRDLRHRVICRWLASGLPAISSSRQPSASTR